MAREEKIVIRVSEEMKDSFQELATTLGMTMSSLGSFVIGNFIREETYKRQMQEKLLEQVAPQIVDSMNNVDLNDPRIAKVIAESFASLANQQQK